MSFQLSTEEMGQCGHIIRPVWSGRLADPQGIHQLEFDQLECDANAIIFKLKHILISLHVSLAVYGEQSYDHGWHHTFLFGSGSCHGSDRTYMRGILLQKLRKLWFRQRIFSIRAHFHDNICGQRRLPGLFWRSKAKWNRCHVSHDSVARFKQQPSAIGKNALHWLECRNKPRDKSGWRSRQTS